ncbi:MAG TPA: TMEM175 family protein [Dyella sp.]|uniref:TMEM175 family protein n=1 Tax=Dyella sp. TaxID=1869338 RepID=UPI002D79318F|nr:TMEM175 family protein [Dyella sp.]HET6554806.1 TMEM175 family protein [Dyella sp.]
MTQGTESPVAERNTAQRHLERLVMLSDGVFAIAITLSAIEIKPEPGEGVSLWDSWGPPLLTYFLSFFLIGLVWVVHRRIVSHLRDIDVAGTVINMVLLSLVALVPVVVRFALTHPSKEGAYLVYALVFAALYAVMALLWGYAGFVARLTADISRPASLELLCKLCFAVAVFVAVAMYQLGFLAVAVLCVLVALPLRWVAWRQGQLAAAA